MKAIIAALGSSYMSDDGVGRAILEALPTIDGATKVDLETDIFTLMNVYRQEDLIIFLDACQCGTSPGTVSVFEESELPRYRSATAHALDPAEALSLMRQSGTVNPKHVYFVLVEAKNVDAGTELSEEVLSSVPLAVKTVLKLLEDQHVENH